MATIQEALETALQYHRAGHLPQAEQLYCQILQVQPEQVDALHLLGLVCQRTGRPGRAVEYIGQALRLKPDYAEAHRERMALARAERVHLMTTGKPFPSSTPPSTT
jgi:Tfp pilus assembly protein PilF